MAKSEDLVPTSVIEHTRCDQRTTLEPKGHDQAHASLARKVHVALATIASPTAP